MKVHLVCETSFGMKGNGVHTAYIDSLEMLREDRELDIVVNNEGEGDVFHSHSYGPYYFWKGRKYKGRRVYTVHVIPDTGRGSYQLWRLTMPLGKWYLKKVYEYADVCIAISPMVARAVRESGAKTRIVNLVNPLPLERWKYTEEKRRKGREMLGLDANDFVVLGVGQLIERKGIKDFLDVAEAIPSLKFVWAGGRPWGLLSHGFIRIGIRMSRAPGNVSFTGMLGLDKMPFVYAAADMMLFPSYQENCPMAPIEAAACGLPVVFRDLEEYKLLFRNPYLKAGSTSEFIELTGRLYHDKSFFREGKRLSEELVKQFDKDTIKKKMKGLYHSLAVN